MSGATERLIEFPEKPTPTGTDIVYVGDSSNSGNEVRCTIDKLTSGSTTVLKVANNLSDVENAAQARANLGIDNSLGPTANLAALKAINVSGLINGAETRVISLYGDYAYDATNTRIADDYNTVAPTSGSGRWLRDVPAGMITTITTNTTVSAGVVSKTLYFNPPSADITYQFPDLTNANGFELGQKYNLINLSLDYDIILKYSDGTTLTPNLISEDKFILTVASLGSPGSFNIEVEGSIRNQDKPTWFAQSPSTTLFGLGGEATANKNTSNGYVGLTSYKPNFVNNAGTFTSFFQNMNTAARTYTFPDRTGTIADNTDLAVKQDITTLLTNFVNLNNGVSSGTVVKYANNTVDVGETIGISGTTFNNLTNFPPAQWGDLIVLQNSGTTTVTLNATGLDDRYSFSFLVTNGGLVNFVGAGGSNIYGLTSVKGGGNNATKPLIRATNYAGDWSLEVVNNILPLSYSEAARGSNLDLSSASFIICPTFISISFNASVYKIILPSCLATNAAKLGVPIIIQNNGTIGQEFAIYTAGGAPVINTVSANDYIILEVTDISTIDGVWKTKTFNTMSSQSSSSVFITGGTISGTFVPTNAQTGTTYTIAASDCGKVITFNNASAITVTVPSLSAGFWCQCIQKGAGQVTFVQSGVTIGSSFSALKTIGQNAVASLYYDTTTTVTLSGDVTQ